MQPWCVVLRLAHRLQSLERRFPAFNAFEHFVVIVVEDVLKYAFEAERVQLIDAKRYLRARSATTTDKRRSAPCEAKEAEER